MSKKKVIILGAAGRDFHNFNCRFRDNDDYEVVAFTATQIPDIDGRKYPAELAGGLYPDGIPIEDEDRVEELIAETGADMCVMAYSDRSYQQVMSLGSRVNAAGADFAMMGERDTQLESSRPVISVGAVRTGCGKSQTSRAICRILRAAGKKVVAIRHPMPYGDLVKQRVQRFAELADLEKHDCTIEEMEEYEPHIAAGGVIYAGVDYEAILREAEKEADIILWDGGNNDTPFYRSDLHIVVADPHRPGHEKEYFPGETNVRLADVVVINKVVEAEFEAIQEVRDNVREINPDAVIIDGASPDHRGRPGVPRGDEGAGGRGRPDPDPRRDGLRRRRGGGHAHGRGRDGRPAALGRGQAGETFETTPRSAPCCRPWAMAMSRRPIWRRPSTPSSATPWSSARPST